VDLVESRSPEQRHGSLPPESWIAAAIGCSPPKKTGANGPQSIARSGENRGNQMRCVLCGDTLEEGNGDNWDDLCPSCADQVSEIMDENVTVDRSEAIEQARRRQS
jgi:hypothetical protein